MRLIVTATALSQTLNSFFSWPLYVKFLAKYFLLLVRSPLPLWSSIGGTRTLLMTFRSLVKISFDRFGAIVLSYICKRFRNILLKLLCKDELLSLKFDPKLSVQMFSMTLENINCLFWIVIFSDIVESICKLRLW